MLSASTSSFAFYFLLDFFPLCLVIVDFPDLIAQFFANCCPLLSPGSTEEHWKRQDAAQVVALVGYLFPSIEKAH